MRRAPRCTTKNWSDAGMRCFGMMMDGRAQPNRRAAARHGGDDAAHSQWPLRPGGIHIADRPGWNIWTRLIDTNVPDDDETPAFKVGDVYGVTGRSLLLFSLVE